MFKSCVELSFAEVFPMVFDGVRVVLNRALSNHFQVSHNVTYNIQQPGSYRFGATYVGTNQMGPGEVYPVLVGDIDSTGILSANVFHQIGNRTRLKFQAQVSLPRGKEVKVKLTKNFNLKPLIR